MAWAVFRAYSGYTRSRFSVAASWRKSESLISRRTLLCTSPSERAPLSPASVVSVPPRIALEMERSPPPRNHGFKRIGLTVRCRLKLQRHPGRDDPACTSTRYPSPPASGRFFCSGVAPGRVFPDLHRQAVHLQKFSQIAHGIIF